MQLRWPPCHRAPWQDVLDPNFNLMLTHRDDSNKDSLDMALTQRGRLFPLYCSGVVVRALMVVCPAAPSCAVGVPRGRGARPLPQRYRAGH